MEHVVQFGINVDDDAIRRAIMDGAERKIISDIKQGITNKLFEHRYGRMKPTIDDPLSEYSERVLLEFLAENKDVIIESAGKHLADRLCRTKAARQLLNGGKEGNT